MPTSTHPPKPTMLARVAGIVWLLVWTAGIAGSFALDDPRRRFPAALALQAVATIAWLVLSRDKQPARHLWLVAIAVRAYAAICLAPAFSEDVFRHVYEGRAALAYGPAFVFEHAPREAPGLGVDPALLDAAWLRINHSSLPTIYPPFAQLTFIVAAAIGGLAALKILLVFAELGAIFFVAKERRALLLFSPLAVLEIAREGHADSLSMLGLAIGAAGFAAMKPKQGYAGFALAALAKLNGLVAIFAALRSTRRGLIGALPLVLLALPLAFAGMSATTSLGAYASAWRSGDGAFSIFLAIANLIIGGDWTQIGALTITQHQLARAFTALAFFALAAFILRKKGDVPEQTGLVLLALLLLSPTLHPWYTLWLLPFAAQTNRGRAAMIALVALVPLLHHPGWLELESGLWTDLGWVRAIVHLPVWALFVRDLAKKPDPV